MPDHTCTVYYNVPFGKAAAGTPTEEIKNSSSGHRPQQPPVHPSAYANPLAFDPGVYSTTAVQRQAALENKVASPSKTMQENLVPTNHGVDAGADEFMAVHVPPHLIAQIQWKATLPEPL